MRLFEKLRGLVRAAALAAAGAPAPAAAAGESWVRSWTTTLQVPEDRNALPSGDLQDATLRQVVRLTIGGERLRVRVSNLFGTEPLRLRSVRVARSADPATSRIDPETDRRVTFGGRAEILVPAGAEYVSDPIQLAAPAMSHLTVSMHLPEAPARQTSHPGSRATSYVIPGDHSAAETLPEAQAVIHWYQLAAVDVVAPRQAEAIVLFGDSITDGFGVQPNTDTRWPDFLARRLQADPRTRHLAVLNQGLSGNRIMRDGLGPNALSRFDRDVLGQPGVRYLIVLIGVNDLGTLTRDAPATPEAHRQLVADMIGGYAQMVQRARERGIKAIGATILPYGGSEYYHPDAANEADRQAVNAWIRTPGHFDAVIDLDAALRDPGDPTRMAARWDSGDGLHPSIAGYDAMAAAVDLELFVAE